MFFGTAIALLERQLSSMSSVFPPIPEYFSHGEPYAANKKSNADVNKEDFIPMEGPAAVLLG